MANTYISRTFGTPTNSAIWTLSFWIKRSSLSPSTSQKIFSAGTGSTDRTEISFAGGNDGLNIYRNISGSTAGLDSTRKFRDTNAWYHIVIQNNNGTAAVYVNGEAETMSSTSLGTNKINLASTIHIFGDQVASGQNFDGIMSHIHFVDGTIYAPTVFGSTDSTTGEWQINTSPSITMGNNGFTILKDGNTITDQSTNSNDFSLSSGTLTKTEDCPSNVFATINPLFVNDDGATNALTKGNNTYTSTTRGEWNNMTSTLGAITGKYYWEVKYEQLIDSGTIYMADEGVASDLAPGNANLGEGTRGGYGYGWLCGNRNTTSNTRYLKTVNGTDTITTDSNNTPVVAGDIVGVAFDATNGKLWFHKNGTYIDDLSGYVGNPTTAAYPYHTGMQTGILYTVMSDVWQNASGSLLIKSYNFGNGYFGTTAVSSAGSNASGNGIFEYDVPTGYTALSTKGLNL